MGRYVPPDLEGVMSGNQIHGKHALGARANKISQGILTVRFEMPYPIWCTTCPKPTIIGQGVRFNAEKKKVGNYFSSPIYSFRMKHVTCGGWIEIRTDPKNTAYVVTEGARKRDLGEDKVEEGDIKILTEEEREALRNNAFAALEGKNVEAERMKESKKRVDELLEISEQHWEDPYSANRRLRKSFREGRHAREKEAGDTAALQDKMSLGLDLLPESEEDARRAKVVSFGVLDQERDLAKAVSKPLFGNEEKFSSTGPKTSKVSKRKQADNAAKKKSADAIAEIRNNTRASIDPFLLTTAKPKPPPKLIPGIKRRRSEEADVAPRRAGLVDYDSD